MSYKAIRHQKGGYHENISVGALFEAAFGSTPSAFRYKSLLGWRPLAPEPESTIILDHTASPPEPPTFPASHPGVKIFETDGLIVVEVELPAIQEDSLYIEISGDLLIIRASQAPESPPDELELERRGPKMIHRYIQLPVIARPGKVRARLEDNTVRVTIPKEEET